MGGKGEFLNFNLNVNPLLEAGYNPLLSLSGQQQPIWNINPVNHQSNMPIKDRSLTAYLTL